MQFRHCLLALAALALPASAHAAANLVTNGDFEQTVTSSSNGNFQITAGNSYGTLTGWTVSNSPTSNNPFNLLFTTGAVGNVAETTSTAGSPSNPNNAIPNVNNQYGGGQYLASGYNITSPTGGNFVALDGDTNVNGYLSQTITGLTVNALYNLTFNWAASQIATRTGDTTEQLQVTFGNSTASTPVLSNTGSTFSGWKQVSFVFKALSSTQTLSFLSVGTPTGYPPAALLDSVSLTAAPEPSTLVIVATGIGALAFVSRRRRQTLATTA